MHRPAAVGVHRAAKMHFVIFASKRSIRKTPMTKRMMMLASALALMAAPAQTTPARAQTAAPTFVVSQPAGEMLGRMFTGALVKNAAGETVGDVNDVVFSHGGQISTVILGVGGFLGMGEKNVGVAFSALKFETAKDGARVIVVTLTKEALKDAPTFKASEKTTYDVVKDKATELGTKASEKAVELKDQAVKKVEEMRK
jgi:PRC-barrel domain